MGGQMAQENNIFVSIAQFVAKFLSKICFQDGWLFSRWPNMVGGILNSNTADFPFFLDIFTCKWDIGINYFFKAIYMIKAIP